MDLQNMIFDFDNNSVKSLYQDTIYNVAVVSNMTALKTRLDAESGLNVSIAVVKLTSEQYITNPTISCMTADYFTSIPDATNLNDVLTSGVDGTTTTEITTARAEIETEITNQIA